MADNTQQQQTHPGHWSGRNQIPSVQKFMEGLDKDKRERDRQIDEQNKASRKQKGEVKPHVNEPNKAQKNWKTVTDPTTGKEVQIADVDKEFMKSVEDPMVRHMRKAFFGELH